MNIIATICERTNLQISNSTSIYIYIYLKPIFPKKNNGNILQLLTDSNSG